MAKAIKHPNANAPTIDQDESVWWDASCCMCGVQMTGIKYSIDMNRQIRFRCAECEQSARKEDS